MKRFLIVIAVLMGVSAPAFAQSREQQIYSPYTPTNSTVRQYEQNVDAQQIGAQRVYPGREAYGRDFGPLTRHPGDYRDAVDRGQWSGGGGFSQPGSRSFSIE